MAERIDPGLRQSVSAIAAAVAFATAVAIPLLYFYTAYSYESTRIESQARRAATVLSTFIFADPELWRHNTEQLKELLGRLQPGKNSVRQRLVDTAGELIVEVGDADVRSPLIQSASLTYGPNTVGRIEVIESIAHVWQRTAIAAVMGCMLAVAMFVALRVLPLRALSQTLGKLEASQARLLGAQEELLRKERLAALGQVTATVSHELRNPLGTIRASIFMVDEKVRDKGLGVERVIARLERSIDRCDEIISDLLDYTRTRTLARERTRLDNWLGTVLDEHDIPERVEVLRELTSGAEVAIDRERLRRAILNSIDNACQAMLEEDPDGMVAEERIMTVRAEKNTDRVTVTVCDTGPGIPPEVLDKVFEPLFSTKTFGVGLGLPVVKQIVEQHGGGVRLSNRAGGGAQTEIWLPLNGRDHEHAI